MYPMDFRKKDTHTHLYVMTYESQVDSSSFIKIKTRAYLIDHLAWE